MKAKKVILALILLFLIFAFTSGGIYLYYLKKHYAAVTLAERKQTETADLLITPDGGWYQLYAYHLKPDTPIDDWHLYIHKKDEDGNDCRLALLEFNLSYYKSRALDYTAMENIKIVLENFRTAKFKVILRFVYDWEGKGLESEPDSISMIKTHMKQAGQAINPFHKIIYTTQGIFVGSWGEMHTSKFLSTEHMTELLLQYASVTKDSIYLAVRTPEQYRNILKEIENHGSRYEEYGISKERLTARLGLFNDGMLGSISDVGTYHEADVAASQSEKEKIRKTEISFQNELCLTVPNGGEAVTKNPYNDWENAINDLRDMRVSYLNQIYDRDVINKWKKSTYAGENSLYHGMSAYDYISRHLGARFVLQDTSLSYSPYQKKNAKGTVTIRNTGFSSMYHEKRANITLINKETGEKSTLFSTTKQTEEYNPCHWTPEETVILPFEINPFDFKAGEYTLLFSLSDSETKEEIPLANDSFSKDLNGYVLGEITIEHNL